VEKGVKREKKGKKKKIFFFLRMCLNLNDHQINTDCYLLQVTYMNLMVTTNPKPTIDTPKVKRNKAK